MRSISAALPAALLLFSAQPALSLPLNSTDSTDSTLFSSQQLLSSRQQLDSTPQSNSTAIQLAGFDYFSVVQRGASLAKYSWEWGGLSDALIQVYNPTLSVFGGKVTAFSDGKIPKVDAGSVPGLAYAKLHINTTGTALVADDGSAGDPASLGTAAVMLGQSDSTYGAAATRQALHLLDDVPRYSNGAISHRESVAEVWADSMYMTPPFLAYAAVATNNISLLKTTVSQITLQRQILQLNGTSPYKGLWQHIVGPSSQTLGLWSTGNAWAALGMARVLATIKNWSKSAGWGETPDLVASYVYEIFDGVLAAQGNLDSSNGLVRSYIVGGSARFDDDSVTWFGEAAATAGLVATMYRMAVLDPANAKTGTYIRWADTARANVIKAIDSSSSILSPTVNPYDWMTLVPYTIGSPEGQAFAAMMGAAYVDCLNAGVCSKSS